MDPYNPGDMNAGPQGMMPPAPGWMSMTPAALGWGQFGAGQAGTSGMEQSQRQAASMFGGSMVNSAFSGANATMSAVSFGSMTVAPLMAAYGKSAAVRGVGTAWSFADPFQWAMSAGKMGWTAGRGAEVAGSSLTLGRGMAGLAVGGLAATGVGLAAQLALQAPITAGQHVFTGASNSMLGQSTLGSMSPATFGGHAATLGQGSAFGQDLHKLSQTTGSSTDELAQITKQLDQMKVFQHTRSVSEFRSKFKEVVGALKEIANVTKQTLEEAAQTFGELKQQGFHTTADITAQAAKTAARSASSGISQGVLNQYGAAGAGAARSMGMRGKFGSDYVQSQVASMSEAYRGMSENQRMIVDEHGGPEEMAANLAAKQMRHLSSARGRAMIAATLGANGAPDAGRLSNLLSGRMTTEGIVESAAGSGLGTLMQAGNPRTREQYMQYAGMMDISMAMSQSKQLYGGTSIRSLNTMMGTMGYSRDETSTMLAQYAARPKTLQMEGNAQNLDMQELEYAKGRKEASWYNQFNKGMGRYTNPYDRMGSQLQARLSSGYQNLSDDLTGHHLITMGSEEDYVRARRGSKTSDPSLGTKYMGSAAFGPENVRDQLARSSFAEKGTLGRDGIYRSGGRAYTADQVKEVTAADKDGNVSFVTDDAITKMGSMRAEAFSTTAEANQLAAGGKDIRGRQAGGNYAVNVVASGYLEGSPMDKLAAIGISTGLSKINPLLIGRGGSSAMGQGIESDIAKLRRDPAAAPLSNEELAVYAMASKTGGGLVGSLASFAAASPETRHQIGLNVNGLAKSEGTDEHTRTSFLGKGVVNSGGMSAEAARSQLARAVSSTGMGKTPTSVSAAIDRWGGGSSTLHDLAHAVFSGPVGSLASHNLGKDVANNGEHANIYDRLMRAMKSGDNAAIAEAKKEAEKAGMDDSGEITKMVALSPDEQKSLAAKWEKNGGSAAIDANANRTILDNAHKREVAGIADYRKSGLKAISEASVTSLEKAEGTGARSSAYRNIFREALANGELSSDEISSVIKLQGGRGEAAGLMGKIRDLAGDNKKAQAAALAGLPDFTQAEYDAAMAGSGDRTEKVMNMLDSKGALDGGLITAEGGAATTVQGAQQAYIEANTGFVRATSEFALMLSSAFPKWVFKGGTEAAGAVEAAGNGVVPS